MGLFDTIGNTLDKLYDYAINECYPFDDPDRPQVPFTKRDPRILSINKLQKLANLNLADTKTRMEEVIDFAIIVQDNRMQRKLENRANLGVYEYEDILIDNGYTENDIDNYIKSIYCKS